MGPMQGGSSDYLIVVRKGNSIAKKRFSTLGLVIKLNRREWFVRRAQRWKKGTAGYSSIQRKTEHPAFQAILKMPKEIVLPLILADLKQEISHWFPALKRLSGVDPVPQEHRGNVVA